MTDTTYPVAESYVRTSRITREQYLARYEASIRDPERYWSEQAACVDWLTPFSSARDTSFAKADFRIRWYADGALNVSANCLDRHLAARGDKTALIWEGDNPDQSRRISYRELHDKVCRFANALKAEGVTKGDRVVIYMPMIPEAAVAMLACTRIGAVHCVVFGGFSPESIASRIEDSAARLVITAQHSARGGKRVPLKANVDEALTLPGTESVTTVITVDLEGGDSQRRELDFNTLLDSQSADCPPEPMNAEDPLFILYTSGSTGKPKGVLHTTGGYLVYVTSSFRDVFDIREDDVYWCTADVGWITGHSYLLYGPLSNGSTSLMFEGVPQYPDWGRFGKVIDKHQVTVFYTAPTAIRSLIREGNHHLAQSQRRSLRLLGSVGEPINPEAWNWYYHTFGEARCPIVDTWWQTETGGILISPLPGATDTKPGSATLPLFGVEPALVDNEGVLLEGEAEGNLVLLNSWPGQMRTVYGDDQRFFDTYFSTFSGMYFTGDGARRDADGYYWITGRVDDVLNVSGHRLGTAEIESALVGHDGVAESAAVGMPHEIKGQGICIFVTLQTGIEPTDVLKAELMALVRKTLGPIATPDAIHWAPALPKTRSGKIMRRILRKIAANELDTLGDTSTLSDPQVVDQLIKTVYG